MCIHAVRVAIWGGRDTLIMIDLDGSVKSGQGEPHVSARSMSGQPPGHQPDEVHAHLFSQVKTHSALLPVERSEWFTH